MDDGRVSSYSFANGNCVEVASGVIVRDTKDPDGAILHFAPNVWCEFLTGLKG